MSKNILITARIPEKGISMLREKGYEVDVYPSDISAGKKRIISLLKKKAYDAVLTFLTDTIDKEVFLAAPSVRIYANYATGYDNIDIAEAKGRGITITNSPAGSSAEAVAEHTIALMLSLAARIVEADDFVRRGKYKGWSAMNFIGTDVLGKTLGILGAGRIGQRVALYGKGLGMKIIYHDVSRNERIEKEQGAIFLNSAEEVLREADVVSLHVPLLPSTKHLINQERLSMMKRTSFLINTSRGPVVDEKALLKSLKEGTIGGAALDVFEFEPKTVPGLSKLPNVILTPHIASASVEARDEMASIAAQNIIDFLEGRIPKNIIL